MSKRINFNKWLISSFIALGLFITPIESVKANDKQEQYIVFNMEKLKL